MRLPRSSVRPLPSQVVRLVFATAGVLTQVVLVGCTPTLPEGPFRYPRATVQGSVTLGGQPIGPVFLTFQPTGSTVGDHTVITTDAEGAFVARDVAVGLNEVRVRVPEAAWPQGPASSPAVRQALGRLRGPGTPWRIQVPESGREVALELLRPRLD